jgi:hypothetical protein
VTRAHGAGRLALVAIVLAAAAACGKKGNPLPPVRVAPGPVGDLQAIRDARGVELRFAVPRTNQDGSSPPVAERVEIYALSAPAAAPPPIAGAFLEGDHRLASLDVARAPRPASPAAGTPPPPGPGDAVTYLDKTTAGAIGAADAPTRYYLVVAVAGRNRRGPPSPVVAVPLARRVAPPAGVAIAYDEGTLRLTWTAGAPTEVYHVDEVPEAEGAYRLRRTTSPVKGGEWSTGVEFGKRRCFSVRALDVTARVTMEGAASDPVCVTPVDRFAPPAPTRLVAIAGASGIDLNWLPADVPDLAGYVVLRGDGAGGTLQALMTDPVLTTSYRDTRVTSGATYVYAVVALDRAGNISPQSNAASATAR